jgi:hypothetical protein
LKLTNRVLGSTDGLIAAAGVVVGVGASHMTPQVLAAGATTLLPAFRAAWDKHLTEKNTRTHKLFFLHQLGQRADRYS